MSGTAIVTSALSPATRIVGAEPMGADDAYRSLAKGVLQTSIDPVTMADGLLTSLSPRTFTVLSRYLERIVTVSEDAILQAMKLIFQRMKIVVEPSAAVVLGALLEHNFGQRDLRVGVILSGGNLDVSKAFPRTPA